MNADLHVLLIGCGAWGALILRDLKALGARVTVVARSERSCRNAAQYRADRVVPSMGLADRVDGVVIATPSDTHASVAREAGAMGVPMFVEKPMANEPIAARAMAREFGHLIFVMEKWRYHAGIDRMRQAIVTGELGAVVGLRSFRLGWSMSHNEVDPIWNLLPHDISICTHLLGDVSAVRWAHVDPLGPPGGGLVAQYLHGGGALATVEVSAYHPIPRRAVVLACEGGTLALGDGYATELHVRRGAPGDRSAVEERWAFEDTMPLWCELNVFLGYLRGGAPPLTTAAEGARVVELIQETRLAAGLPA